MLIASTACVLPMWTMLMWLNDRPCIRAYRTDCFYICQQNDTDSVPTGAKNPEKS